MDEYFQEIFVTKNIGRENSVHLPLASIWMVSSPGTEASSKSDEALLALPPLFKAGAPFCGSLTSDQASIYCAVKAITSLFW